jgi:hypothetical protein
MAQSMVERLLAELQPIVPRDGQVQTRA